MYAAIAKNSVPINGIKAGSLASSSLSSRLGADDDNRERSRHESYVDSTTALRAFVIFARRHFAVVAAE